MNSADRPRRPPRVAIVADDLTGAADTGVGFATAGFPAALVPLPSPRGGAAEQVGAAVALHGIDVEVVAIDTDTRAAGEAEAVEVIRRSVAALSEVEVCYLKIDSMLRGHPAVSADAAVRARGPDAYALVAPAFPGTGRTTVNGRQWVAGEALPIPPLTELFGAGGRTVATVGLSDVRRPTLPSRIAECRRAGATVVICDAVDDADLAAIARAGLADPDVVWVGAGGLAAQLANALALRAGWTVGPAHPDRSRVRVRGPVLVVVGTMAPIAAAQVADLIAADVTPVQLAPREPADRVGALLAAGRSVVVTLPDPPPDGRSPHRPNPRTSGDPRLVADLARRLVPHLAAAGAVVATGGDTARALLGAAEIARLDLVDELEPGVVLAVAPSRGLPVVTKAGSFGSPGTLATVVRRLTEGW